jgi:hypothetical protein
MDLFSLLLFVIKMIIISETKTLGRKLCVPGDKERLSIMHQLWRASIAKKQTTSDRIELARATQIEMI